MEQKPVPEMTKTFARFAVTYSEHRRTQHFVRSGTLCYSDKPALMVPVTSDDQKDDKNRPQDNRYHHDIIAAAVFTAFALALRVFDLDQQASVTISFLTLAMARILQMFNMCDDDAPVFRNDVTSNPWVWGDLGLCLALILSAVFMPGRSRILRLVRPTNGQWLLILGCSALPLILGHACNVVKLHYHNTRDRS